MKKAVPFLLFLFAVTGFLPYGEIKTFAGNTGQVSCGDYELVTRKRNEDGREEESLFRINNKTGETWILKGIDTGWVKIREQK